MKRIASGLAIRITKGNNNQELFEVYSYCFQVIMETLVTMMTNIIIALWLKMLLEYIILIVIFVSVRSCMGGLHMSTFFRCYIFTNFAIALTLVSTKICLLNNPINTLVTMCCVLAVYYFAPVQSINRPLSDCEKTAIKIRLRQILLRVGFLAIAAFLLKSNFFLLILRGTMILALITEIAGIIKNYIDSSGININSKPKSV
ncbi:accessory gene regulator B [Lachnospiraceae bacterium PF1-21]|uniref:Accessory gene regulator B family protein n=1 Tax=Ohessyouella blattaphilus TaxID=2949333 RepID=A0ABT1EM19_9FIRM|nr:accessory gene regulator B family protein [Ohessyouella blattaphilus]MCP1111514.1 accessory gene regulator B family protein [Ohessyouella blattaphilus]MCR8564908.1 accessory gene regulator B family protein [Ohessyouella blattaphilus]